MFVNQRDPKAANKPVPRFNESAAAASANVSLNEQDNSRSTSPLKTDISKLVESGKPRKSGNIF